MRLMIIGTAATHFLKCEEMKPVEFEKMLAYLMKNPEFVNLLDESKKQLLINELPNTTTHAGTDETTEL